MTKPINKLGFIICLGFSILYFASPGLAQDLTLNDSIGIALSKNPQVVQAQQKVNSAYAKLGEAVGGFLPKLSLDASVGQNYSQPMTIVLPPVFGGGTLSTSPDQASNYASYSLTLSQPIFKGGRLIQAYSISDITYKATKEDLRRAQNEAVMNVTSAFYEYLKAQKGLAVIDESTANLKRNLDQAQVFFNAGIGSNIDLLRAKTQLANLQIMRIKAESGVKIARLAFETSLGQKLAEGMELKEEAITSAPEIAISQEAVIEQAYANRPEWLQYKMGLEVAEKAVQLNYSDFLPSVSYMYSRGESRTSYPDFGASNSDLTNWRSMLIASWNLFNGFQTVNSIKAARADFEAAQAQQQIIRDGIALEVNSSYLNLISARDQIGAAQIAADLAERTLRSAEISYKSNILSEQDYLGVHAANQSAQLGLVSAKYDFEVAKAKLNKAVGKTII